MYIYFLPCYQFLYLNLEFLDQMERLLVIHICGQITSPRLTGSFTYTSRITSNTLVVKIHLAILANQSSVYWVYLSQFGFLKLRSIYTRTFVLMFGFDRSKPLCCTVLRIRRAMFIRNKTSKYKNNELKITILLL